MRGFPAACFASGECMEELGRMSTASLQNLLQEAPVALALVLAAADEGDGLPSRKAAQLVELGGGLGNAEAIEVAAAALGPGHAARLPVAQQRQVGAQLAEPQVDPVLANAAGPAPHDEHAEAVGLLARLVDALEPDRHGLTLTRTAAAPRGPTGTAPCGRLASAQLRGRASTTTAVPYASTSVTPCATSLASYRIPMTALAPSSLACWSIRSNASWRARSQSSV